VRGTRIDAAGLTVLRRDLAAISKDANREAIKAIRVAAEPVRRDAARRAPRSAQVPKGRKTVRGTPSRKHLADSLRISVARNRVRIVSNLAHARVVHDGGRHPLFGNREHWVPVRPNPFIARAAEAGANRMLDDLADGLDRLILRHGFHR
jgi:hypothetical protein